MVLCPKLNESPRSLKEKAVVWLRGCSKFILWGFIFFMSNKGEQLSPSVKATHSTCTYNPDNHIQHFAFFPLCPVSDAYGSFISNVCDRNLPITARLDPTSTVLCLSMQGQGWAFLEY